MSFIVRVVGFSQNVGIQRAHAGDPVALKFIALQGGDLVTVVMGFTSQHRALALMHVFDYDTERMRAFYGSEGPDPVYPSTIFRLDIVAGGWISVGYHAKERVPAEDRVQDWESRSLHVITSEAFRSVLEPVLLAHVHQAIAARDAADPLVALSDEF